MCEGSGLLEEPAKLEGSVKLEEPSSWRLGGLMIIGAFFPVCNFDEIGLAELEFSVPPTEYDATGGVMGKPEYMPWSIGRGGPEM